MVYTELELVYPYYEGILETDELIKVENDIWNNLYLLLNNKAKNNQFIAYAR